MSERPTFTKYYTPWGVILTPDEGPDPVGDGPFQVADLSKGDMVVSAEEVEVLRGMDCLPHLTPKEQALLARLTSEEGGGE